MSNDDSAPAYPVSSVGNALQILLMLRDRDSVGVSQCARALKVAPSTAHRLLGMMMQFGFVQQDADSRLYRAGPALVGLGLSALEHLELRRIARPHLEALAEGVNETVNLIALEQNVVRFLDCVESKQALRIVSRIGLSRPVTTTSVGKALLALMPPERLDAIAPHGYPLATLTEYSMTDRQTLDAELLQIRQQGYATNFRESDSDIAAVGVAIRDPGGRPSFGIAVAVPTSRMTSDRVVEIAAATRLTAAEIERSLSVQQ